MWHRNICEGLFRPQSLDITERLILADLNYCLLSISRPELLEKGMDDLKRYIAEAAGFRPQPPQPKEGFVESAAAAAKTRFPLSEFS
jgi:hypothetical protein